MRCCTRVLQSPTDDMLVKGSWRNTSPGISTVVGQPDVNHPDKDLLMACCLTARGRRQGSTLGGGSGPVAAANE